MTDQGSIAIGVIRLLVGILTLATFGELGDASLTSPPSSVVLLLAAMRPSFAVASITISSGI